LSGAGSYLQAVLVALALLAGVAFLLARARRGGAGWTMRSGSEAIRVEAVRGLGPRHRLLLVECGGRRYLLGLAADRITVIDRLDPATEKPSNAGTFS
jgi:flagellar biogenesis protein FliO